MIIRILFRLFLGQLGRDVTKPIKPWRPPDYRAPANAYHDYDEPHDPRDDGRHCPICGRPADFDAVVCWACGEVVQPMAVSR